MSGDPGALQSDAVLNDGSHVAWSVLRAAVFGLTAAVAGAGLYAAVVILTGYEVGLVAIFLGLGVGFAVAGGHPRLAGGWVRALSVMLTLFSLALSTYLILWLYDGEGFAPVPISVGEAVARVRDGMTEEPAGLWSWILALLSAFGIGKREDLGADDQMPAQTTPGTDFGTGRGGSGAVVQVVKVAPRPLRAADLELVVVIRAPGGGFLLRRLSLAASDLPGALPHLFDPDSEVLARSATTVNPCRVVDQAYDSADEALAAAQGKHPAADPDDWVDGADFREFVENDSDFGELLKPDAARIGARGSVALGLAWLAVAATVIYAGYRLNVWVGLDTPERRNSLADNVFATVVMVLAVALAWLTGKWMARLFARHNLAQATTQGWQSRADPDDISHLRHPAGSNDLRLIGTLSNGNTDPSRLAGRADTPTKLVERPRVRLYWCAGALVLAASSAVVGIAASEDLGRGGALAFVGAALVLTLIGAASLRWSIIADESGLTVTNLTRRYTIAWADLKDVQLEKVQAELDLGFHYLLFVTNSGKRIRADAPTGRNKPGSKLPQLKTALLDMRSRYTASP